MKKLLTSYRREALVGLLGVFVFWALHSTFVGGARAEIETVRRDLELRDRLRARVRKCLIDARSVATVVKGIQGAPLPASTLAATLERFHRDLRLGMDRARLVPRGSKPLEGGFQEESVEVVINGMSLDELIRYLQGIEGLGASVRLRTLRIQKSADTAVLNLVVASLRVS